MEEDKINPDWLSKNQSSVNNSQTPNNSNNPSYPDKNKKSGLWVWILVVIILIIAGLSAIIYLNETELVKFKFAPEKYYAKYGIEKIWQGLSVVPTTALTQSSSVMDKVNSYKYSENISFNTGSASTTETDASIKPYLGLNFNNNVRGEISLPNSFYFKKIISLTTAGTENQQSTLEGMATDKLYFISGLESDANKWISAAYDSNKNLLAQKLLPSVNVITQIKNLQDDLSDVNYIATEKINNTSSYHFKGKLRPSYLLSLIEQNNESLSSVLLNNNIDLAKYLTNYSFDIDFWIAKKSKFIEKISFTNSNITILSQNLSINYEIDLSDYNSTISFAPIDQAKIVEQTSTEFAQTLASDQYTGLMMFNRDLKRKQALQSIKTALDLYKQENTQFPVSATITKTNDSLSPLMALVTKYLAKLPLDPNDPNNYYGYISDGNSYILTSILDNISDSVGVKSGNYYLYKLTN